MLPSLVLAQLRIMREVASVVKVRGNIDESVGYESLCYKANIKYFRPSKQIFSNYLNKFQICMATCCSYDVQMFMERNPEYCSPGRPIACTQCKK